MNEQVDPSAVIESLSNQIASMSRDIAILQALNAQFRTKLAELESPTAVLDNQ
jgi:hypothetical protein